MNIVSELHSLDYQTGKGWNTVWTDEGNIVLPAKAQVYALRAVDNQEEILSLLPMKSGQMVVQLENSGKICATAISEPPNESFIPLVIEAKDNNGAKKLVFWKSETYGYLAIQHLMLETDLLEFAEHLPTGKFICGEDWAIVEVFREGDYQIQHRFVHAIVDGRPVAPAYLLEPGDEWRIISDMSHLQAFVRINSRGEESVTSFDRS